jgi:hypothetical protein
MLKGMFVQGESRYKTGEHSIKVALSKLCVITLHRLVFGRFLQSCARPDTLSASGAAAATAARRTSSIHMADSAFVGVHFRHPASAESELEHHLYTVLINLGSPHSALSRATISYLAEFLLRVLYGPAAEFARECKFSGDHGAALELRLLWNAGTANWSHSVSLQLAGVAEHLHSLADVNSAHEQGLFTGKVHAMNKTAIGSGESLEGSKQAKKDLKHIHHGKGEARQACGSRPMTRARMAPRRSARFAAAAASEAPCDSKSKRCRNLRHT